MKLTRSIVAAVTLSAFSMGAFATSVSPAGSGATGVLTDLGSFAAGTYNITATGIVDLVGNGSFRMRPNGLPETSVTAGGYSYFNPNGSDHADGATNYGAAGAGVLIGALIGTFTDTPTTADWFLIGYSKQVTLGIAGHIYASVNDTFHNNNTGHFDVTVTAVPEPETYAMLLAGLGLMGAVARRKKQKSLA